MKIHTYRLAKLITSRELAIKPIHIDYSATSVKLRLNSNQRIQLVQKLMQRLASPGKEFEWKLKTPTSGPVKLTFTHKDNPDAKITLKFTPFRPVDINHVELRFEGDHQRDLNTRLAAHLAQTLK